MSIQILPFLRRSEKYKEFSNWYPANFTDEKGVTYNCSEQYYMAYKAINSKDTESERKIMASTSPSGQKKLGKNVKNFCAVQWNKQKDEIMDQALFLKYTQNPDLRKILIETHPHILVEGNKYDRYWGVGLDVKDPRIFDQNNWQGKNKLGEALMKLRNKLLD
uniref:YbiA homolog protein n=1 Tax=Abalone asfa-like virus TaxID=2839893 RepID=A0A5K7XZ49_9VIRU|nr:YbiA homolog protein [Abalone asfa-like virus]BCY04518.1 hypothetical protein [Abalone asfa-like virus]